MGFTGSFGFHNNSVLANTGLIFRGSWDANTNNPFLQSGVGINGEYYIVSVAGNTNLDGNTGWQVSDWAIFEGSTNTWQKINNSVISAYSFVLNQNVLLPQQNTLDFQGAGVTATNSVGKTIVTVPIQPAYATIQSQSITNLPQQPILNFIGSSVSVSNGVGKTNVTINTGANGTLNRIAMFTPSGTTLGNSPIGIGNTTSRLYGTNTGTNSLNVGYNNTISGIDSFLIGYDLQDGGGQEVYALGNRLTINPGSSVFGVVGLGFFNNISNTAQGLYFLGDSNVFTTSNTFTLVVGENNTFDNVSQTAIVGNNSSFSNISNSRIIGTGNNISNSNQLNILGDNNIVDTGTSPLSLVGSFNNITNSSYISILGENNDVTSSNDSTIIGSFNTISGISNKTIIATGGVKGGIVIDNVTGNVGIGTLFSTALSVPLTVRGSAIFTLAGTMTFPNTFNLVFGTVSCTRIGTATTQKIGFWNATPIVQPTTSVASATFVQVSTTPSQVVSSASTFDGYTIGKVVKALRNLGLLA
jgi:hypothetical protein